MKYHYMVWIYNAFTFFPFKKHGFSPNMIVPHGSYLMNCGSPNDETRQKSKEMLADELQRCEKLGLAIFNFHPGSYQGRWEEMHLIALVQLT